MADINDNSTHYTFAVPLISLIVGIGVWGMWNYWQLAVIFIGAGLLVHLAIMWYSKSPSTAIKSNPYNYIWIILEFAGIGILTCWLHSPTLFDCDSLSSSENIIKTFSKSGFESGHIAKGVVKDINTTTQGDVLTVQITGHQQHNNDSEHTISNVKSYIYTDIYPCSVGDIIMFPCRLKPIENSENHLNSNYAATQKHKGIFFTQRLDSSEIIKIKSSQSTGSLWWYCRNYLEECIQKTALNKSTQNFLITILLGDRHYVDQETRKLFSDGGISHILALSGMHISIMATFFIILLFPLNIVGNYKWKYVICIILIWLYVCITGASASVVRSAIMVSFCFMALVLERQNSVMNSLFAAAFVILLFNPDSLFDIGMQLSFMAVGCLIVFVKPLNYVDRHEHYRLYTLISIILVTLIATASTFMISAYYFKEFPLMFLPINLIVVPLLPVYIALGLIYILFETIGFHIDFLRDTLDFGLQWLLDFVTFMTDSGARTITLNPSGIAVISWCSAIAVVGYCLNRIRNKKGMIISTSAMMCAVIIYFAFPGNRLEDSFIIQHRNDTIGIAFNDNGKESIITLPLHSNMTVTLYDKRIVSLSNIGRKLTAPDISKVINHDKDIHYLIICNGCYAPAKELQRAFNPEYIVLHPSLNTKLETMLKKDFLNSGCNVISMRENGAIKYVHSK